MKLTLMKSSKVTLNNSQIINKLCMSGKLLSFSQLEILCLDTYNFSARYSCEYPSRSRYFLICLLRFNYIRLHSISTIITIRLSDKVKSRHLYD